MAMGCHPERRLAPLDGQRRISTPGLEMLPAQSAGLRRPRLAGSRQVGAKRPELVEGRGLSPFDRLRVLSPLVVGDPHEKHDK